MERVRRFPTDASLTGDEKAARARRAAPPRQTPEASESRSHPITGRHA